MDIDGFCLVLFHFALPFLLLLSREFKRNPRWMGMVAGWVIVMRIVDLFWLSAPANAQRTERALARCGGAGGIGRNLGRGVFLAVEAAAAAAHPRSAARRGFGTWTRVNRTGRWDTGSRDANVRSVSRFVLGLVVGIIAALLLMWFLFDRFAVREARRSPQPETMAASNPQKEPPEPRLQPTPVMDLKEFRAGEEAILNDYGWVNPEKGIVRIPVERALELVAKEGLPSRKETQGR